MRKFLVIVSLYLLIILTTEYVLVSDSLYYDMFANQLSAERMDEVITQGKKWKWVVYIVFPIFLLIKFAAVASCLLVGSLLSNYSISFKKLFEVSVLAEFVFLIPAIVKILWFGFFLGITYILIFRISTRCPF